MKITYISVSEVEYIALKLAREVLSYNEPIPDFSTRFPNILEHCILAPKQSFSGKGLYKGLIGKASILFYLMTKNHPFQNGNKRIAMTTLFILLYKNKRWLKVDTQALYNFTMWIAQSPSEAKDETVHAIEKFITRYLSIL